MEKIQVIAVVTSLSFLFYIGWLIIRGKLREEYAIIWIISTLVLIVFSFWRDGLVVLAEFFGVIDAPNLVFTGAIFAILIYLLHLSVTVSRLQQQNKKLSQDIALLREKELSKKEKSS
jgi:hypothetical protein